jgi:hypothetical protein
MSTPRPYYTLTAIHCLFTTLNVPTVPAAIGTTQYIDGLRPKDLPARICKGVDNDGREFIAFKVVTTTTWKNSSLSPERSTRVMVAFRRYSNNSTWVLSGVDHCAPLCREGCVPEPDPVKLMELITGKSFTHDDYGVKFTIKLAHS